MDAKTFLLLTFTRGHLSSATATSARYGVPPVESKEQKIVDVSIFHRSTPDGSRYCNWL